MGTVKHKSAGAVKQIRWNRETQICGHREQQSAGTVKQNPRAFPKQNVNQSDRSARLQTELAEELRREPRAPGEKQGADQPGEVFEGGARRGHDGKVIKFCGLGSSTGQESLEMHTTRNISRNPKAADG